MQLQTELVQEFAAYSTRPPIGAERRTAPRFASLAVADLYQIEGGAVQPPVKAAVRDVSANGIGIYQTECMSEGQQFIISLPRQGAKPLQILCVVVRTYPIAEKLFVTGASFMALAEARTAS